MSQLWVFDQTFCNYRLFIAFPSKLPMSFAVQGLVHYLHSPRKFELHPNQRKQDCGIKIIFIEYRDLRLDHAYSLNREWEPTEVILLPSGMYTLCICLLLIILGSCFSTVICSPSRNTSTDSSNSTWTSGYPGCWQAMTLDD
jgi:hypothetical protein